MTRTNPFSQRAQDVMVRPAFTRCIDQLRAKQNVLMATSLVEIIMFEKHRRGQNDVCDFSSLGHELLMHANEQIITCKTLLNLALLRRHSHRVHVLDKECRNRRPASRVFAGQNSSNARLIELPD